MTEAKYRKKPVTVHAFQYNGDLIDSDGKPIVPAWAIEAYNSGIMYYDSVDDNTPPVELYISTLEGVHHAPVGDYIVRGVKGELYPVKPEIFELTYERVE